MGNSAKKERKFHIARKIDVNPSFNFLVRFFVIILSFLLIVLVFTLISGLGFSNTIKYMFNGAFGTTTYLDQTILNMMQLLILAIGLVPAFKMKYWNTGALGQALIGNFCSSLVVFYLGDKIPNTFLLLALAFFAAIIGGGIWGGIPGIFKAKFKANETLFTLMMNYIASQLVIIFIDVLKGGNQNLKPFERGVFSSIGGITYAWPIIICVLTSVFMIIYMKFSKHGYELSVLGESYNTAKYAGINTDYVIIRTSILSGAICAMCGFMFTASSSLLSTTSDGGYGFTSIIVAWSSHFSIVGMFIISFIIAFLKKGSDGIRNKASDKMNEFASYISVGIFLLIFIGCEFFLNYKFVPTSEYAKIQEEKLKKLQEKYPKYYQTRLSIKCSISNAFSKVNTFLLNLKESINNGVSEFFGKIASIFKKKNKEEN